MLQTKHDIIKEGVEEKESTSKTSESESISDDVEVLIPADDKNELNSSGTYQVSLMNKKQIVKESKIALTLAIPVTISYVFTFAINFTNIIFVGHLGAAELSAISLAISFGNITGYSFGVGLVSAIETLVSQAYGAKNFARIGTIVQRAILIVMLYCIPCSIIWWNTEYLLIIAKQDNQVSKQAGLYLQYSIPGLFGFQLFEVIKRYLSMQEITKPIAVVSGVIAFLNILAQYLFIHTLNLGISGSAMATSILFCLQPLIILIYIILTKIHKNTWYGWSKEALKGWKEFLKLGLASALMITLEWWAFEITILMAGIIGVLDLAAHTVLLQTGALFFMVPLGIGIAASQRIGSLLGAGKPEKAKFATKIFTGLGLIIEFFLVVILAIVRTHWAKIFVDDPKVIEMVSESLLIMLGFLVLDAMQAIQGGELRGAGKQTLAVIIILVSYYPFGLPLVALFVFQFDLEVNGIWFGMCCGVTVLSSGYFIALRKMDWQKESQIAQKRAGVSEFELESNVDNIELLESQSNSSDT